MVLKTVRFRFMTFQDKFLSSRNEFTKRHYYYWFSLFFTYQCFFQYIKIKSQTFSGWFCYRLLFPRLLSKHNLYLTNYFLWRSKVFNNITLNILTRDPNTGILLISSKRWVWSVHRLNYYGRFLPIEYSIFDLNI